MHADDEEEERRRQAEERKRLSLIDRLYGGPKRKTDSGFDDLRSTRRTGRVVQFSMRVHPRVRAIVELLITRDSHPSAGVMFEEMVDAYCERHGAIDNNDLPSDDELVRRYEKAQDAKHAK